MIKVLFVDDEPYVLDAIRRTVRTTFDATFAGGGQEALDLLDTGETEFEVVCSDMRMPTIDGLAVLNAFREKSPDTTRLLLTGQADLETAVLAVNQANVFRFLLKPTSPDELSVALTDAAELRRTRRSERELLEETLHGSIEALVQALSLANPLMFTRAIRIRRLVKRLVDCLEVPNAWEIEIAAMLAQLGAVALPPELSGRLNRGVPLDREDLEMVADLPDLVDRLLARIPRLEEVRNIIRGQRHWQRTDAPLGTKLLMLASELDTLTQRTLPPAVISEVINEHGDEYGRQALAAFASMGSVLEGRRQIHLLQPKDLRIGMELVADVKTQDGLLLVGGGQAINESLLARLTNFARTVGLEGKLVSVYRDQPPTEPDAP